MTFYQIKQAQLLIYKTPLMQQIIKQGIEKVKEYEKKDKQLKIWNT